MSLQVSIIRHNPSSDKRYQHDSIERLELTCIRRWNRHICIFMSARNPNVHLRKAAKELVGTARSFPALEGEMHWEKKNQKKGKHADLEPDANVRPSDRDGLIQNEELP